MRGLLNGPVTILKSSLEIHAFPTQGAQRTLGGECVTYRRVS